MAETGRTERGSGGRSALLPEHSLLSLEEYLAMQRAIGNETRFRILDLLVEEGAQGAAELRATLDIESNTLHYHLDELVDVGLVENRKRTEPSSNGLYSYYRATSLGEGILEHGVRELMREEWELLEDYGG
ncbi:MULTISPECIES: winged helix-turn-helix domain-containing protein [Haloferacaceae]|uniref:Helix-turn-helix domain-containing protein n=1 Tax=Halorubrum glutamatedens TaxID=2707018 RepID=A0ABD5QNC7_9EURY|nr:helix-turn-helix domain-containing protein [Halobellus captivus]